MIICLPSVHIHFCLWERFAIGDMLPPLSLTLRSGGFLFDSPNGLSITLSCAASAAHRYKSVICGSWLSQAQLDRAWGRALAVCWRSIPSHRSETSRWSVLRDKKESVCSCKQGIRSLLLSLHPLRVCHFCVKMHSLLSLILYDRTLVNTIYSGFYYNPTAISIRIIWFILFYQNFLGRKLVNYTVSWTTSWTKSWTIFELTWTKTHMNNFMPSYAKFMPSTIKRPNK